MTRYYEYNHNGGKEKYAEITETEYLLAREEPNRWFISFGDCVLECEQQEHADYYREKNHHDYTQRDRTGKKIIPLSLEEYENKHEKRMAEKISTTSLEIEIIDRLGTEWERETVHECMKSLKPYEQELIYQIFWDGKSQSDLARKYGISQQVMSRKINRILSKMMKLMKKKK